MFKISNFNKYGVAYPLKINKRYSDNFLEKKYFEFRKISIQKIGKPVYLKPHLLSNFFYKIATDTNIIKNVKKIIGKDLYIWSSAFFVKVPGESKFVSYHQDNPYWELSDEKVLTAWIALTKSDKNSGALEVFPKSHLRGIINKLDVRNARKSYLKGMKTTKSNDMLSFNHKLNNFIKNNKPEILNLLPSEYSIHHVNTIHGSGINKSKRFRIGFAVRYVSSDTYHLKEKNDSALHISGKKNKYYVDEIYPKKDFTKESIKQYKKSLISTGVFGDKKY